MTRRVSGTLAVALVLLAIPGAGRAEQEDFTFRRVKVGDSLPGKRITVQIDPVEQARRLAATAWKDPALQHEERPLAPIEQGIDGDVTPGPGPKSNYAWYWDVIPSDLNSSAGRFPDAMAALRSPATAMSSTTLPDRIRWDIVFTAPICSEARPGMGLIVLDRHELIISNLTRNRQV